MMNKGLTAAIAALALAACGAGSAESAPVYVLMNVPYNDFYKAELAKNAVPVDAVTSATVAKAKNAHLVGGTYHTGDDTTLIIEGVTFPVKVDEAALKGFVHVASADELFSRGSYAWTELTQAPAFFKEMSVAGGAPAFGKVQGLPEVAVANVKGSVRTRTRRGDYQLKLDGFDTDPEKETLYGVIVRTAQNDYGMRRLENIWRGGRELGWNVGYTKFIKDVNPTFPAHYKTLTGTTITGLTYITDKAVYNVDAQVYLPVLTGCRLKAENAALAAGHTAFAVEGELPGNYVPVYDAGALDGGTAADGRIVWSARNKPGEYEMKITDEKGVYETLTAAFVLSTDVLPAAWDAEGGRLVPAGGEEDFKNYLRCVRELTIDGTAVNPKRAKIIDGEGRLDLSAPLFKERGAVTVRAAGYPDLSFEAARH